MAEYVKVMGTVKDDDGNKIDTSDVDRQWVYDCGTNFIRDCLFAEYEKQLCGCVKRWE